MIGIRTPVKPRPAEIPTQERSPQPSTNVRKSVGEWETGGTTGNRTPSPKPTTSAAAPPGTKKVSRKEHPARTGKAEFSPKMNWQSKMSPKERAELAKSWFGKGHAALNESRNLKGDLKETIKQALNQLNRLYREAEEQKEAQPETTKRVEKRGLGEGETPNETSGAVETGIECMNRLSRELQEHTKLLEQHKEDMGKLKDMVEKTQTGKSTYADTLKASKNVLEQSTLHSIIVTSKDETETGEEVLERVRKAVDAKEGWVQVERVRKAKDRKVIMGCRSKEERQKVVKRLEEEGDALVVEEVQNKDPLLILRDVLTVHSDTEVIGALRKQNRAVFDDLNNEENRVEVKYRRRARNPHNAHIVISVSPKIWGRAVAAGRMRVDLQNVRVEDQTPLLQCTRCLGFGHGRRFCKETIDLCGHCGGPHMRSECGEWLARTPPTCKNCVLAKSHQANHDAFSHQCPVRKRWDTLARAAVAYC